LKILILKPSSLGDVVQALPVLRLLRRHLPSARIYWWIESSLSPLLENDPDLTGLYRFDRKCWASPAGWSRMWDSLRSIRREGFDLVIDLQGLSRSALVAWLANGETSVGLSNPREGTREGAPAFYDLRARPSSEGTHAVERYLAVLGTLGVPVDFDFEWLPARPEIATQVRTKWRLRPGRWVILQPGARWDTKQWPAPHFADVVRQLAARHEDLSFAVLGSRADKELARQILPAAGDRCLDLTGRTTLAEMVEWIRLSNLVITNDTGPMHVAAALRKPLVAIFGPTNPASTGPYGQRSSVLQDGSLPCIPCLKRICTHLDPLACLRAITSAQVFEKASRHLTLAEPPPSGIR